MSAQKWLLIAAGIIVLALCAHWYSAQKNGSTTGVNTEQRTGIANPASVNCVQTLGGTLEIADRADGQIGLCHLKDGRVCEEWALMRDGTCVSQ